VLANNVLDINVGDVYGRVCLCLSAFPLDLEAYVGLNVIVDLLGPDEVQTLLRALINTSGHHCTYPPHSKPTCSSHCEFTCDDGYTKVGDKCVCKSPNTECNGQCGYYPHGCSSSVPRSLNSQIRVKANGRPVTFHEAQTFCGRDQVCGIYSKPDAFECVNTKRAIDSCGGCTIPFHGGSHPTPGVDCSALANSLQASCVKGQCVVKKCTKGYEVTASKDSCVEHKSKRLTIDDTDEIVDELVKSPLV